jgi:energy-coupling factor transporter ATP-binding protein EcfA2
MARPLVSVRDLQRSFDASAPLLQRVLTRAPRRQVRAVDGVSFDVGEGSTFAIVGESGCGKSTVTRLVAGLDTPTAGEVHLLGRMGQAPRVLPLGVAMGLAVPLLTLVHSVALAAPLLAAVGALAGLFVVPMNALLQHRGQRLLGGAELQ